MLCVHLGNFTCSSQHTSGEQRQAAQHVPVQPEVGEQWEEFLRYALEMQRQLAKGDCCFYCPVGTSQLLPWLPLISLVL